MCSGRQQQFLFPDPEVVIEFVHVADKISGSLSVRKNRGANVRSGDIDAAPRAGNLVAVWLQCHSEGRGFSGLDVYVLRRNFVPVINHHHRMFSCAQLDRVASVANGAAIHEHVCLRR